MSKTNAKNCAVQNKWVMGLVCFTRLTDLGMFSLLKQDAVRELLTLQEQQRAELRIINNALLEETGARENLERRLCELRTEVKNGFIRNIEIDFCISAIVL